MIVQLGSELGGDRICAFDTARARTITPSGTPPPACRLRQGFSLRKAEKDGSIQLTMAEQNSFVLELPVTSPSATATAMYARADRCEMGPVRIRKIMRSNRSIEGLAGHRWGKGRETSATGVSTSFDDP